MHPLQLHLVLLLPANEIIYKVHIMHIIVLTYAPAFPVVSSSLVTQGKGISHLTAACELVAVFLTTSM